MQHLRKRKLPTLSMAPMIDCVFLLLIFFIDLRANSGVTGSTPAADTLCGVGSASDCRPDCQSCARRNRRHYPYERCRPRGDCWDRGDV